MRIKKFISIIAFLLIYLVISLPILFAQEINYQMDANGNLVTGDGYYRSYNGFNQLIQVRNGTSTGIILEEYLWSPIEERILVKDVFYKGIKNYTVYYVSKDYVVVENKTGNYTEEYIYQDDVLVAQVDTNGNKIAVHPDHEGSSTTLTNAAGNTLETTFYSAYGELLSGGTTSRFDYEGKEFDPVVGDYDFNFRKYKTEPPLFTQPDTLIQNIYDPQSLNRYAFERNNPYKYTDPTGHQLAEIMDNVGMGPKVHYPDGNPSPDAEEVQRIVYETEDSKFVIDSIVGGAPYIGPILGSGYHKKTKVGETEMGIVYANPDGSYTYEYKNKPKQVKTEPDPACGIYASCADDIFSTDISGDNKGTTKISFQADSALAATTSNSGSNSYNRYSSSGGEPRVDSNGTTHLGSGGRSGSFRCYATSCSATEPYIKPKPPAS